MNDWITNLFVTYSDLFLKMMNKQWDYAESIVDGMITVLKEYGVTSGTVLDLCCGNGRMSVYMAKKGFTSVGIDISQVFIDDAKKQAKLYGVSDSTRFIQGDIRKLSHILEDSYDHFDVIVNAWTSIGYFDENDDLKMFTQARVCAKDNAVFLIAQTMHSDYLNLKFVPTGYHELEDVLLLEKREYDPITSQMKVVWTFYGRQGNDLKFIDTIDIEHHIYSLNELSSLLNQAGWKVVTSYGSFINLQSMTPLTSMNIVAQTD